GRAGVAQPRHQIVRLLERAPVPRPLGAVPLDAMGHVAVAGLGRRHEGHARPRKMAVDGEAALAATRATENESRRSHARVLPRRPSRKVRARAGLLGRGGCRGSAGASGAAMGGWGGPWRPPMSLGSAAGGALSALRAHLGLARERRPRGRAPRLALQRALRGPRPARGGLALAV